MMAEKRQTFTAEFQQEVVRLVTEHHYGMAETARNLGIVSACCGVGSTNSPAATAALSLERAAVACTGGIASFTRRNYAAAEGTQALKKSRGLLCQRLLLWDACIATHHAPLAYCPPL
jgi:hypothetical protein